jgi:adhesin transport system membrane fusion protein
MMRWLFPPKPTATLPAAGAGPDLALIAQIKSLREGNAKQAALDVYTDIYAPHMQHETGWMRWGLYGLALVVVSFFGWAGWAQLEEVTSGTGKVIPTSREQVVQSMEGGLVAEVLVVEGDLVEAGQPLLRIDDVRMGANLNESQTRIDALMAAAVRLRAESQGSALTFPDAMQKRRGALLQSERDTFEAKRRALESTVNAQQQALRLAQDELRITEPLAAKGLVSDLDVLRIQRTLLDARSRITEVQTKYRADAAAELARIEGELGTQNATLVGREDSFRRTVLRASKRGIVKNIRVNTVGGVVQPGQDILEIIPIDDSLLIETRIRPSDIAFLRPGMAATVKITAYDSGVYGWLDGQLLQLSPDTLRDEVRREETYYRVIVKTQSATLLTPDGRSLPIIPGMLAQVDIKTGQKSVLSYLFKPVLRAREALRER